MSFTDTVKAVAAGFMLMAWWAMPTAWAEENSAAPTVPASDECRRADQNGVPPPPGSDCTEYQLRLEQQAKRMESEAKIMEQQARRLEFIAKAKAAQDQIDKKPPPAQPQNPPPSTPAAMPPLGGQGADRVLEVFGDQARIRYRGGEFLVRAGQALPQGGSVAQVSLDGVILVEGRNRRMLPFYIGAGERQ